MPFSLLVFLLAGTIWVKDQKFKNALLISSLFLLLLMANSYVVNKAFRWWEGSFRNISDVRQTYHVGILLSGGLISLPDAKADHPVLGGHGDRVLQTYLLYKAGKIRKILITGISAEPLIRAGKGESRQAAALLVQWGIPAEDILFEEQARNTRENALYAGRILRRDFSGGKFLMITSAFHMRRSAGCFAKAGIKTDGFPADFYGGNQEATWKDALIPNPDAVSYSNLLWHEWIGFMVYKIVGYC